jgi:hypothetical protein
MGVGIPDRWSAGTQQQETIMSDLQKAQLKLAKLKYQVDDAGLKMWDGNAAPEPVYGLQLDADDHIISGTLDGTHRLDLGHSMLNDTDVLNFNIVGGEHFDFTISGFHPQTWDPTITSVAWDGHHDLLNFNWVHAGVSRVDQAFDARNHYQTILNADGIHHDVVETIHTSNVDGTITFLGLGDYLQAELQAHPGWNAITWFQHDHVFV